MDLTDTIAPKSDQINADDLMAGPQTVTIESVNAGTSEQPVNVHLVETPGRPFRPSKSMRRVMVAAWGRDSSAYAGRRMTLYRDPSIKFGGMLVGGIRISHMSHIPKRLELPLTVTRGKREKYTVEPLPDAPAPQQQRPEPTAEQVAACTDVDTLKAMYRATTSPERQEQIKARAAELNTPAPTTEPAPTPADDYDAPPASFFDEQEQQA